MQKRSYHIAYHYAHPLGWGFGSQTVTLTGHPGMTSALLAKIADACLEKVREGKPDAVNLAILSWQPFDYEDEPTEEKA